MNKSGKIDWRSINKGKERNCFFGCISKLWSSLPIPSIYDVFTSGSAIILRMRDEINWDGWDVGFFSQLMDYVWKLIILASSRIVKTWAKQPDKKDETPPRTIQWTFSIQSDATIKQISRRPALKWPINTINLWRCGCETGCAFWLWLWTSFSMSKDFWYTVYTYL